MMLFRRATIKDLEGIHHLASVSGVGMTTLPKEKSLLKTRLQWSCDSFDKKEASVKEEYYLFVLEDTEKNHIVGTSAIESCLGTRLPFYSYKISRRTRFSKTLNICTDYEVLTLVNDNHGKSEICTLFLLPEYRHHHLGLLLSRARFLFMAQFSNRFSHHVIADMRGFSDESGRSPFWEAIGHHFFKMTFSKADRLTLETDKQLIADLMPQNPIYVSLLPKEAQDIIGKPHPSTLPAMNILLKEGFRYLDYLDIFDAGPTIEAPLNDIRTLKLSQNLTITSLCDEATSQHFLVSNNQLDFKALITEVISNTSQRTAVISKKTASLLGCNVGDTIRVSPLIVNDHAHFQEECYE